MRGKFTCRDCEKLSQAPVPYYAVPRSWAGTNLLATIVFEKYGQHQPLNRQSERYATEGVELSISTLADQVGPCAVALRPLHAYSSRNRSSVPVQTDHLFHNGPNTDSSARPITFGVVTGTVRGV